MAIQLDGTTGISTSGNIIAAGTLTVGLFNPGNISASGNVVGANLITAGELSVGGNSVITGDLTVVGNASLSGNIIGDKITNGTTSVEIPVANGNVSFTIGGSTNVVIVSTTGGYVTGVVSATGNITGSNLNASGLSLASNVLSAINSTSAITTSANVSANNVVVTNHVNASGNISGDNVLSAGQVSAIGNVTGSNFLTAGVVSSAGNITGGNIATIGLISSAGNITGGNLNTTGQLSTSGNLAANNISVTNSLTSSVISASANVTGGNILTNGLVSVTGNVFARGLVNANANGSIDFFNGGTYSANIIFFQQGANGNVTIRVGESITEAPGTFGLFSTGQIGATGNIIGGNLNTAGAVSATGNVIGNNLNAAGLSLSSNVISALNSTSNITTTANIAGSYILGNGSLLTGIDATSIQNGTSNVRVVSSGGNVAIGVGGTSNVAVYATTGEYVTGLISATGNITGNYILGNGSQLTGIDATSIQNGTSNVRVVSSGGNVSIGVGGTSNIAVYATTGEYVTGLISATGNITGGNLATGGTASVTGNVTGGNVLTGGLISATGNITGGNVISNTVVGTGLTLISTGDLTLSTTGNINANNEYINNVPQPQQNADAANKQYVDNLVSTAISYHSPVIAATISNLDTATGGTITYAQPNGVANGVGATLTTTGSFNLIDTANIQTIGTRVLVKDEGNAVFNGVYTWANATVIVRATDADTYGAGSATQLGINDYFFVQSGNVNAGAAYIVNAPSGTITFGTSNITFAEFSKAQIYSANTSAGISLNGTVINALVDNVTTAFSTGNIVVKTSAQLTTPNIGDATGTSLSVTGNITGGNLSGTSIVGTLTTAAQTNITSVGTLGSLAVTGNTTSGNFVGTLNGSGANVTLISATNISSGTLAQARLANASLTVNGTSIALGGSGTVTATATGTLTIGTGLGGTSYNGSTGVTITNTGVTSVTAGTNIAVSAATGGVTISVTGTVPTATTAGTVTTAAQSNITSVGTLTSLTVSGNSTQANINLTTNSTSIRQTSTSVWSGDAAAGQGKLEYHSNRWYVNAGSDSTLVCQFRRGSTDVASVDNSGVYSGTATTARYADLAEKYSADADYAPGTVLTFGGIHEVTVSTQYSDARVAGVVSTNPAHLMNTMLESEHTVALALTGRVPTKVTGTVRKGDMMISAGNGAACACATPAMGTVIGKALENFDGESGVIEIVVGRL